MKAQEIYEQTTARLIEAIEQTDPNETWKAPWHNDGRTPATLPTNALTRKLYRGGNVLQLWAEATVQGYSSGVWATFNQWTKELGCQVRKGETATWCVKWVFPDAKKIAKALAEGKPEPRAWPSSFFVFNADQVDGYVQPEPVDTGVTPIEHAEAFFAAVGANVTYEGNAAYHSWGRIVCPPINQFDHAEDFYATLGHEHVHWTGIKGLLNRTKGERFGDDAYAYEELIAEIGAAFLCAHLGISNQPRPDHAQYLAHWLRILRGDSAALYSAAGEAQKAVDLLLERAGEAVQEKVA